MIENLNISKNSPLILRANHISNYLNLQGTLPEDKEKILSNINYVLKNNNVIERVQRNLL